MHTYRARPPLRTARMLLAVLLLAGVGGCEPQESKGEEEAPAKAPLTQVTGFGSNPGNLLMYTYAPRALSSGAAPLVVVLHGCTQSAADVEAAGWSAAADAYGFRVVYPQQQAS